MLPIKLLAAILCAGLASCARLKMSMSAVNIPVDGELKIKVTEIAPNITSRDFNKLRCGFLPHGLTQMDALAEYDVRASKFDFPSEGQPSRFNGRISFEGHDTIKIRSIRFEDTRTIFYCILDYYVGAAKLHVETMKHQLQNVYTMPAFTGGSSYDETIELIFGKPKTFFISVKSIPASNITCTVYGFAGVELLPIMKSKAGKYFVTTQQMKIRKSSMSMDGKKIVCYGNPKFGRQIEKKVFLKIKPDVATFIAPTPSDVVILTKGENRTIVCTVKSRQPSEVSWEPLYGKINTQKLPMKQVHTGDHYLTTAGIRIIAPSGDIGKGDPLRCNGIPQHGEAIHRTIYFQLAGDKVQKSAKEGDAGINIYQISTYILAAALILIPVVILIVRLRRKYVMTK
eukprot:Seg968.9 transcript_id=Seg968.9/GoldUCD/mRNA.D3Y31 product="hypothetical protein" protein_id=Seg968.9/GoldUCD/D3Y31